MAVLVVLLVLVLIEPGISQLNRDEKDINIPIRTFCGFNAPIVLHNFINNRNSTLSEIRSQLSSNGVFNARAHSLSDGDSVFGAAQCRNYLSAAQCVACFDVGVSELVRCSTNNGAYIFFDNCFIRYNGYATFYDNPNIIEDMSITPFRTCDNQSSSLPTTPFTEVVEGMLSDIRVATPKTSNFYVASTRQVSSNNATVYAIAQCVEKTTQAICQNCINTAYTNLYNCLPSKEGRSIDMGCFVRYSETPFFSDNQTMDITNLLRRGSSSKLGIKVGGSCGAVVFLLILALSMWYNLCKKENADNEGDHIYTIQTTHLSYQGIKSYRYKDLKSATQNFSEDHRIGKGGFGEVFKAIIDNQNVVAVKKLHIGHDREKLELNNELKLMSNVGHQNLLRLLGWCSEGSELLLVLEYMPNGSLSKFLWGEKRGTLKWRQRFDIIFRIARGLAHLHHEFHIQIIHRDIKPDNILLDDNFQPKIADFGLARFKPEDQSHVNTQFAGTLGYTAPEYATRGHLTEKVDTYSFGIMTLEIISGRRCTDVNNEGISTSHLLEHAWQMYEKEIHADLIDETLDSKEYEQEHVTKIIEIALMCTQSPHTLRPTMSEVVLMLSTRRWLTRNQITRPTFIDPNRRIQVDGKGLKKI